MKELCPDARNYGDAYHRFGLFGGQECPTIMAHCVYSEGEELELLKEQQVFVAHCPASNTNLSSGIAPVRRFLTEGVPVGLGSDVAGGTHTSIFRAMADAIQVSKLRWRLVDADLAPLTAAEAFYLGTAGGGAFFGKVGSFLPDYEFDAVILDDSRYTPAAFSAPWSGWSGPSTCRTSGTCGTNSCRDDSCFNKKVEQAMLAPLFASAGQPPM